uniref:Fimbrial protein n=1 Tax=Rhizophora mucronata TaxID=61149 RepID=A0A2P2ITK9_RHIMU
MQKATFLRLAILFSCCPFSVAEIPRCIIENAACKLFLYSSLIGSF